ncbi:Golgi-specific brefeldin A-resistance guanine nucleotide exchange factor 1-like isoform X2 [Halichondria panicea]|uniref:Golgi-specific brefeldin A-resistance guanine nucleotide exchange factor 1-like isoform X2 n=1 Tax=Halichondria panicea TaxID=6063 RepID=UPI00312B4ABA
MSARGGVCVVQGEVSQLLSAIRRGGHWSGHVRTEDNQDPLIQSLYQLQSTLHHTHCLSGLDVCAFIAPFCAIIQSDDTTGPVTGRAIAALDKFLAYGLIDPAHSSAPSGVESLSEAVTHARFVGTNPANDEVVLMKILEVLRTLLLSPAGRLLSNESVCEVMQSCFRICFEMRLTELLRCQAESTLVAMVALLFSRLPEFSEEAHSIDDAGSVIDQTLSHIPVMDDRGESPELDGESPDDIIVLDEGEAPSDQALEDVSHDTEEESHDLEEVSHDGGVTNVAIAPHRHKPGALCPYGLPCVKELLRFLTSIINTSEKNNSEPIVAIGLNLVTVAIERGSTHLCQYSSLTALVQDSLCKFLLNLLSSESFLLFSRTLKCCYLLFQSCRPDLKLQLEVFMTRLMELAASESGSRLTYDKKELALECIVQLCHLPHFTAELYVNFDCSLYCSNVFETLTKTLSKNCFPSQGALFPTHLLSLDALLAINDRLENGHVTNQDDQSKPDNQVDLGEDRPHPLTDDTRSCEGVRSVMPRPKELLKIRQQKKLILAATEQFNKKPKVGVAFLLEQGVLHSPLNPNEVAGFLLDNPGLVKARIGEYVGERKNTDILHAFVRRIPVHGVALVDALRVFLESFRLLGESPVVERILESFSQHWLDSNADSDLGRQFANRDAVHVLTYAIMMLNTDLHSKQIKKKMTIDEFVRNQRKTNNKLDFPREFLISVYHKIKEEEIIMPDEHTGTVKENYQWKVLIHRSASDEGTFLSVTDDLFDHDLFLLSWGPTVAALSFVFDNAEARAIVDKAIAGFSKCACVAARYELREVFDNLIISLCKFTTLLHTHESASSLYYALGVNPKVRQSVQAMFSLAQQYGDILREGWKNLLDCLLALFKAKLLPDTMVEVSDFLHCEGKVSLYREEVTTRQDSSLLSSLYSYWLLSNDQSGKALTPSEIKARKTALECIQDCHPEQLFTESKFLRSDSLLELVKALSFASRGPEHHHSLGTVFDEEAAVFFVEQLVIVAVENKDRVLLFWEDLSTHLSRIILTAGSHGYMLERGVVSLLRLAVRLLSREDMTTQLLSSLKVLLSLPPPTSSTLSQDLHKQAANGITELVQARASLITQRSDWSILFTIIEYIGLGISPEQSSNVVAVETTEPSHDDTLQSDSSVIETQKDWVVVTDTPTINSFDLFTEPVLPVHEPQAFFKCCELLSSLVRSDSHITPSNFPITLATIRRFTEIAASQGSLQYDETIPKNPKTGSNKKDKNSQKQSKAAKKSDATKQTNSLTYATSSLRLLDLLDALYTRVPHVYDEQAVAELHRSVANGDSGTESGLYSPASDKEGTEGEQPGGLLWQVAWRPLLQGMARMCCDGRRTVRQTAITYLQRALLAHELQVLTAGEWLACFQEVFFPMLTRLLADLPCSDRASVEETRVRGSNLLCKVFLQHLPSLSLLPTFNDLWLTILDYMDQFLHLDNCDLLYEAIPESLKNMLLVMSTQGIFDIVNSSQSDPSIHLSAKDAISQLLWQQTQERVEKFLPNLLRDLFPGLASPKKATPTKEVTVATVAVAVPSPAGSPIRSTSASPLSTSPVMELHTSSDSLEGAFPIILHPPLPPAVTVEPTSSDQSNAGSKSDSTTSLITPLVVSVSSPVLPGSVHQHE